MKNPKTTVIGILTALVTLITVVLAYLQKGTLDGAGAVTGILGILAALGFYHASDGGA